MLLTVNQQEKTKLNFSSEKGFSQPQAHPALSFSCHFQMWQKFQVYLLVPAFWGHLHKNVSALMYRDFSPVRDRQTSALSMQTYLAEQEIPGWSGGILKRWNGMLQNASLASTETGVCYL